MSLIKSIIFEIHTSNLYVFERVAHWFAGRGVLDCIEQLFFSVEEDTASVCDINTINYNTITFMKTSSFGVFTFSISTASGGAGGTHTSGTPPTPLLQGYLAYKKVPPPPRTTVGP